MLCIISYTPASYQEKNALFMKKNYYIFFIVSAILYFLPFFLSNYFWWLIFVFPIPLLYATRTYIISFIDGYLWSVLVFLLHGSGGICAIGCMAQESELIGYLIGIAVAFYAALFPALCFFISACIMQYCRINHPLIRLLITAGVLFLFIIWADSYCLWIFGNPEGYPLMHPLLPLTQWPSLLTLLPIVGKQVLTVFFLLVPLSVVVLMWYKNCAAIFFLSCAIGMWIEPALMFYDKKKYPRHERVASLPLMVNCTGNNPSVMMRTIGNHCRKIIADNPPIDLVAMPESACNLSNDTEIKELVHWWGEQQIGKAIHIIFGACRQQGDCCYNTIYWVYNGVVQQSIDKKHAMLLSERVPWWMDFQIIRRMYGKDGAMMTCAEDNRSVMHMYHDFCFVPYICSELFFNEYPIDTHNGCAIIAMVNDTWFADSYIAQLLVALARLKAILWQRDIVYVSYTQSVRVDKQGYLFHQ